MPAKGIEDLLEAAKDNPEVAKWLLDGYAKVAMLHAQKLNSRTYDITKQELGVMSDISARDVNSFKECCCAIGLTAERR